MYKELLKFYKKYEHCNVPITKEYKHLGNWVKVQRRNWKKGILAPERLKKLNLLNFEWIALGSETSKKIQLAKTEADWEKRLKELIAFRKRFGHCKVPYYWQENKSLGMWLSRQRNLYKTKKLPSNRLSQLLKVSKNL